MEKLGELLVQAGLITPHQLGKALARIQETGEKIGQVLVSVGLVSEEDIVHALSTQLGIPMVDLSHMEIEPSLIRLIPERIATTYGIVPVQRSDDVPCGGIIVASADPTNLMAEDAVRTVTGLAVDFRLATQSDIHAALSQYYGATEDQPERETGQVAVTPEPSLAGYTHRHRPATEDYDGLSAVELVNAILQDAVSRRASDIHIEPLENEVQIRCRVDGLLRTTMTIPKSAQTGVISRIKILSNMDIGETRKPQDGRARVWVQDREVDLRVSVLPIFFGEKAMLRVLDRTQMVLDLEVLGFLDDDLALVRSFLTHPQGMILITGPTGGGKTTTLYSVLNAIRSESKNVVTVEDPVEFQLEGINQVQVNERAGLTFATGLRSILRQDPNVIMIGEIRDIETAEMALQASLTGHLVLSTLHTNDAPAAVIRLVDLRLTPYIISATLFAAIAQRLVRKVHSVCKEAYSPDEEYLLRHGLDPSDPDNHTLYRGVGCPGCDYTGYLGRTGIFQVLVMTSGLKEVIAEGASLAKITQAAREWGMRTLFEDGLRKARLGITTVEEILRVVERYDWELPAVDRAV